MITFRATEWPKQATIFLVLTLCSLLLFSIAPLSGGSEALRSRSTTFGAKGQLTHYTPQSTSPRNEKQQQQQQLHELLASRKRVRRQASQKLNGESANQVAPGSGVGGGANAAGLPTTGGSSSGDGSVNSQFESSSNQDGRPPEETLSQFKCDFGSADAPDMCKFEVLESENPLTKGLATWSLGNGKLALFQGGPIVDAGSLQGGNDSFGAYIFYETSNPYLAATGSNQPARFNGSQNQMQYNYDSQFSNGHGGEVARHTNYAAVLAIASSSPPHTSARHSANHRHEAVGGQQQFQQLSSSRVTVGGASGLSLGPTFQSPNLTAPGPNGMCLSFYYAIQGLSADELRVHANDHKTGRSRQIWAASESAASNWTRAEVLYSVTNKHSLLFSASSGPQHQLTASAALKEVQQRKFRGYLALDEIEVSKLDPLAASAEGGSCKGHCNFDGDLCGWTNAENGLEDNFDWSFGRGSDNLFTGPARDFTSSSNDELTGSFLFTDSGYPRRPGDRATLVSPMFQPTAVNEAMCMRFAVHMFGSGVGSLAIKIRFSEGQGEIAAPDTAGAGGNSASAANQPAGGGGGASGLPAAGSAGQPGQVAGGGMNRNSLGGGAGGDPQKQADLVIWEMSGDAGNSWHQAQTSVSSAKSPFQVLIEGAVGENHLGNIAIDEISFSSGPCPTSPPAASKNYGDCTFEQSMCFWRNPDADIHLDDLDWVRTVDEQSIHGPNVDHTLKRRTGAYLKLENTFREPKSGSRAFLLSPIFQPKASGSVQCLSFYYYMFMRSIGSSGPNLGTIRVYLASNNELVPIWRLTNPISAPSWKHGRASLSTALIDGQPQAPTKLFQIAFEGIWGDAASGAIALDDVTVFDGACDIMPAEARSVAGECTFDVDLCSWTNKTQQLGTVTTAESPDDARSPFLQSVAGGAGAGSSAGGSGGQNSASSPGAGRGAVALARMPPGWQLATVDSRPVNLQDHTYKAPIGYAYVDVLGNAGQSMPLAFTLQSAETNIGPSGQPALLCLSFWFAAFGRQEANQLQVHLTQASAPPGPPEEGAAGSPTATGANNKPAASAGGSQAGGAVSGPALNGAMASAVSGPTQDETENANAWKAINGKLLWSAALRNISEPNRRKWLYGQTTLKADSNYIVRFVAVSSDGGFALDDVSYFEGACETRPGHARLQSAEDEAAELQAAQQPQQAPAPALAPKATS